MVTTIKAQHKNYKTNSNDSTDWNSFLKLFTQILHIRLLCQMQKNIAESHSHITATLDNYSTAIETVHHIIYFTHK